ncbi:MAG: amidohydrolase family protein [Planctomycetota bacterium]
MCSWAAACSICGGRCARIVPCRSASARTSAPAPLSRCWRPWPRRARWRRCAGSRLGAQQAFYLATRSARALDLEGRIGTVAAGMDADLVVLDLDATPLIAARVQNANDLDEVLYVLMTLGDDRAVRATYVGGKCVWAKASEASPDS